MAIFTRSEFAEFAKVKAGNIGLRGVVNESRKFSQSSSIRVFLSHSHKDIDVLEQAKLLFENAGVNIYVDWADKTMPEQTNGITASKIKAQIKDNHKFVLLGTNNAVLSKWCNWEVGIGDVFKQPFGNLAILPLADNNRTWEGNEYLQLYPRIEKKADTNTISVLYPDGKSESFESWLKRI
jgi:hypothetical protein